MFAVSSLAVISSRATGKLIFVGIGEAPITLNPFAIIGGNKYIGGSIIAGSKDMKDMLQFAADHNVRPTIELVEVPFGANNEGKVVEALQKVKDNKVRFRMVLKY